MTQVASIRARWLAAKADPTVNPAWANAEIDIGLLLSEHDALKTRVHELESAMVRMMDICATALRTMEDDHG